MASILDTIDTAMLARIQAMRLMDDDFMTVVFDGDNATTEFLLRILLNRDDLHVKKVTTQKEKRNLFGRSVRLDILAEDDKGKLYNERCSGLMKGLRPSGCATIRQCWTATASKRKKISGNFQRRT